MVTNSNMKSSMAIFTFSVLDWKYPFWENLVQKIKIISLSWNLEPKLIWICRLQFGIHFCCFKPKIPFLGKFGAKIRNCHFKLRFDNKTNSNMQNPVVIFLERKYPFWVNLLQKIKIVSLFRNLLPRLIRICRIQWCGLLYLF